MKDGKTSRRDHLESVERQTGIRPPELDVTECPDDLYQAWIWFCDLAGSCSSGMVGREPITYSELRSWSDMTGIVPTAEEVELIRVADRIIRSNLNKETNQDG